MTKDHSCTVDKHAATNEPEPLWTYETASRRLNCSQRHLQRLIDSGKIPPPLQVGGLYRYQPEVIEEWIAAQASKATNIKGGRPQ
ncbi:helix-turn-helix domain-containing protein [Rhodopirellula sp. UBA1907]|uniref:helix-turn-helix domain-containing protein n=1 Tax=Rhodopirellula TaxID=265488 RepID=UPI0039C9FA84